MLKIEIEGVEDFLKTVSFEAGRDKKMLANMLTEAALETHKNAITSIKEGPANGRTYKRRTITHQASAAGDAPKTDTGALVRNITFEKSSMTVGSRKDAPHGFWLEFGTSKMAARPWLQPAFDKMTKWFDSMIAHGVYRGR